MDKRLKILWGAYAGMLAAFIIMLLVIPIQQKFVFYAAFGGTAAMFVIAGIAGWLRMKKDREAGRQIAWPDIFTVLAIQLIIFAFLHMASLFCPEYIAVVAELIVYVPAVVVIVGDERLREAVRWLYRHRKAVILTVLAIAIAVPALHFAIPFAKYKWAGSLMEKGEYARAAEMFAGMGDYMEAETLRQESVYREGVRLNEQGEHDQAYFVLSDIQEYGDVAGYIEGDEALSASRDKYAAYDQGSIVEFGVWNGEPMRWHVLDQQGSRRLLFAEGNITTMRYNEVFDIMDWENCSLRAWLNDDFMAQAFQQGEDARILETAVVNADSAMYRTEGGKDTVDKVFLLSIEEADIYRKEDKSAFKGYTSWLRSPGCSRIDAALITEGGGIDEMGANVNWQRGGVRPVMWIDIAE